MVLSYQRERFAQIIHELPPLFSAHWIELGSEEALEPDWARFAGMDASGVLHCITCRDAGKLVGYFFALVTQSLHYASVTTAYSDGFFLLPEYRKGMNGVKLLRFSEKYLADLGVKKLYLATRVGHDLSTILARLEYTPFEELHSKAL